MTKDDRQDATTCLNQRQSQEQGEWGRGAVEVTAAKKEKKKSTSPSHLVVIFWEIGWSGSTAKNELQP